MSKKKLLQTRGILKERDPARRPSGGLISTARPLNQTVETYIRKYANKEELADLNALITRIEVRRSLLPKFYYLICEKCGYKIKTPFGDRDLEPDRVDHCPGCNSQRFIGGGKMREMSTAEAVQYDADVAARSKRFSEQATKAGLFSVNTERQKQGLEALTLEQYRANEKREMARQREMESRATHKYFNQDAIEAEKKAEQEKAGAVTK